MCFVDSLDIHASTKHIQRFKHSDAAMKIRNGITFDFYIGLPHIHTTYIHTTYIHTYMYMYILL